jgi:hypothetical protein
MVLTYRESPEFQRNSPARDVPDVVRSRVHGTFDPLWWKGERRG